MEYMENITITIHGLKNFLSITETCTNRLKNADAKTMNKRWLFMKDIITATGRDRLGREIALYKKWENSKEKAFGRTYDNTCKRLSEANGYYEIIFDLLDGSNGYSEKNKKMALDNGNKLIERLKDIINELEKLQIA